MANDVQNGLAAVLTRNFFCTNHFAERKVKTRNGIGRKTMNLYVVVRHRRHQPQRWQNVWLDDNRLWAIETTAEIGRFCKREKTKNKPIFVHRCAWAGRAAIVCCSAPVVGVDLRGTKCLVTFGVPEVLNAPPPPVAAYRRNPNRYFA